MAVIGQQLTNPEEGWRRYDERDPRIQFIGSQWVLLDNASYYSGTIKYLSTNPVNVGACAIFKFYGTKFRLIGTSYSDYTQQLACEIDGAEYPATGSAYSVSTIYQVLQFEVLGLEQKEHTIKIYSKDAIRWTLDVIDIDSGGYLLHPVLPQKYNIFDMNIGDCILCRYRSAFADSIGIPYHLGVVDADTIIPDTGATITNGYFYFVKVAKGLLIADRVVQHSISWDKLHAGTTHNPGSFIDGKGMVITPNALVTASAYYVSPTGYLLPEFIFDNDKTKGWYINADALPVEGSHWVKVEFKTPVRVNKISISCNSIHASVKNFTLQASDNNASWVNLYSGINSAYNNSDSIFAFENVESYKYYRILVIDSYSSYGKTYCGISELKMFNDNTDVVERVSAYVRSISGGVAYADANGQKSLTDRNLGAWPINNEWDTYIANSDLDGKITPGDDNIWHRDYVFSLCKETNLTATYVNYQNATTGFNNTHRICRGYDKRTENGWRGFTCVVSLTAFSFAGFRPVLEYVEADAKASTLYY